MIFIRNDRLSDNDSALPQTGGWQFVYTGFVLILLCFFIMLTSFASLQKSKITRFTRAFSDAVSVFDGGKSLEEGKTMIQSDAMVLNKEDALAQLFEKVRELDQGDSSHQIDVTRTQRGVVITLSEKLLFLSGEAKLTAAALPLLDRVVGIIRNVDVPVEIEGHTDDRPIRKGRFASNWELSTARAVAVLRHMIEKQNAPADRISAVGFSKYRPLVANETQMLRAKNRRVEIVFKTKGSL